MDETTALIVFVRIPEKGRVKTRLARDLDDSFVLDLYQAFVCDLLERVRQIPEKRIYVWPPGKNHLLEDLIGRDFDLYPQQGRDLGEKMAAAFNDVFSEGKERAILIGTDIPELGTEILQQAGSLLETHPAVLGPSADGGYYLIGARRSGFSEKLFKNVPWSTNQVLSQTLRNAAAMEIKPALLPELSDIDTVQDLRALSGRLCSGSRVGRQTADLMNSHAF